MHFEKYLAKWNLIPDGDPINTNSSNLLPVMYAGKKAMLKVAFEEEELFGGRLLNWWEGDGAVRVYQQDSDALLLERAIGTKSLMEMAKTGHDDEVTRIICASIKQLHKVRLKPLPELIPLQQWFSALLSGADKYGELIKQAAFIAEKLLANPKNKTVLHGDIHHQNILDSKRGWLAIDPKGLYGERAFDYANLFCNPDRETACKPDTFIKRVALVCEIAGFEHHYLMEWILAWAGLSAIWCIEDDTEPAVNLCVAEMAFDALSR